MTAPARITQADMERAANAASPVAPSRGVSGGRKVNLVRNEEILRVIRLAQEAGLTIATVDVRRDGVTVSTGEQQQRSAFDAWKSQDKGDARPARR